MSSSVPRISTLRVLCGISFTTVTRAQVSPPLEQGLKAYGSYNGGNIDTVNLMSGHLSVRAPFYSLDGAREEVVLGGHNLRYPSGCPKTNSPGDRRK